MSPASPFLEGPAQPTNDASGLAVMARLFTRVIAVALIIAALGLWLSPQAGNLPELVGMKLCASFFFSLTGLHMIFATR